MKTTYVREKQHQYKKNAVFITFLVAVGVLAYSMRVLFFFALWIVSLTSAAFILLLVMEFFFGTGYLEMMIFNLRRDH